jgi:Tol biopolymer transport system component
MQGQFDVYTISLPTGSPVAIASDSSEPSWSADGRWLYFHSDHGGKREIWRAPAQGGEAEQLTTRGGDHVRASPDGKFLYFAREEGSGDLWRKSLESGRETLVLANQRASGGCWDVQRDGVYFVDFIEAERSGRWSIKRLNPDSGAITEIVSIAERPFGGGCLSVSPDSRWLLYTQDSPREADLMLLKNFR